MFRQTIYKKVQYVGCTMHIRIFLRFQNALGREKKIIHVCVSAQLKIRDIQHVGPVKFFISTAQSITRDIFFCTILMAKKALVFFQNIYFSVGMLGVFIVLDYRQTCEGWLYQMPRHSLTHRIKRCAKFKELMHLTNLKIQFMYVVFIFPLFQLCRGLYCAFCSFSPPPLPLRLY